MTISITVILFNKWILAYSGFPFPIALTLWHMAFCSFVGLLSCRVFKLVRTHDMSPREYFNRVMPIGILYAASLWLSNSAYLYLSVSFIQMTKSLMPGLVYATGIGMGTEKFAHGIAANMCLIAFGVVVCAIGEVDLVIKGLLQQLLALVFEATRLTLVQVLINSKGYAMNPMQSLYYVSPACFICLFVPFVALEMGPMLRDPALTIKPTVLLANALAALALNLAVFLLIGKTSALTMNIAGVIKDWMLIFFSFYLFKAPVTALNLAGYAFCCSGVAIYNYMKLQVIRQKAALSTSKDAEKEGVGNAKAASAGDASTNGSYSNFRSKEDILEEIKRLQNQMASLESRSSINTVGSKEN